MAKPLVSIVTATYNSLDGLRRTIESVSSQEFDSFEHVIVDGGSSDGSVEFLKAFARPLKWISEPDDGIADAMNKGIALAEGEYILVLHAEDTFVNSKSLGEAAESLASREDIVSFDVQVNTARASRVYPSRGFGTASEFFATVPHQGAFCRSDLFAKIDGFDGRLRVAMDYEWMLRAKRSGASLKVVPQMVTIMPANGVSSRRDWPALRLRLDENRTVQRRHALPGLPRLLQAAFWLVYPKFKRLRHVRH